MSSPHSDALVFFGATGDLAYKKDIPCAAGDAEARPPQCSSLGVAKVGWTLEQLKARAHDNLEKHGGVDPTAFEKLASLLRYVDGARD